MFCCLFFLLCCVLFCGVGLLVVIVQVRMELLDDDQFFDVVGQVFINFIIDVVNGLNFICINFGVDIEI